MDLGTVISKIRAGLEWLTKSQPPFTGKYVIEIKCRDGKIVEFKKTIKGMIL